MDIGIPVTVGVFMVVGATVVDVTDGEEVDVGVNVGVGVFVGVIIGRLVGRGVTVGSFVGIRVGVVIV